VTGRNEASVATVAIPRRRCGRDKSAQGGRACRCCVDALFAGRNELAGRFATMVT
jgi:hypothetical protein